MNTRVRVARDARAALEGMNTVAFGQIRARLPVRAVLVCGQSLGFHGWSPAPSHVLLMDPFIRASNVDSTTPFRAGTPAAADPLRDAPDPPAGDLYIEIV